MTSHILGIHHITAITADAQKNIDFYRGVLGLRLVKVTVNFDDPRSYHLYYGDDLGRPGSLMTFFVWAGVRRGRHGPPQPADTSFAVPAGSMPYWQARLAESGAEVGTSALRFGDAVLAFADPDGLRLELVASKSPDARAPAAGPIPAECAIRGICGVTLAEEGSEPTAAFLTRTMGLQRAAEEGNRSRYAGADRAPGGIVDILSMPGESGGSLGAGIIHHVAFRLADDAAQVRWRQQLLEKHTHVSPIMDRLYFRSIYFREPGGVLFELATEPPGFTVDEPPDRLGTALKLPPHYEQVRPALEAALPRLHLPTPGQR
jgi:catechol 2,3-dioxygenase-like lactoylglutathione lyase family enzyme